jgi:cell division septum initiation protein DivIVA
MTDKEFKRLSRAQLIDIIYQLQLKQEELTAENEKLSKELADKRLRVREAGNLAEAALEIHNVMQAAQDAATHYLAEIKTRADHEYRRTMKVANDKAAEILEKAQQEAAEIVTRAQTPQLSSDAILEAIVKEFGKNQSNDR